jgi:aryl-alcohol dehydrogenase-like predicted oxidoreductase
MKNSLVLGTAQFGMKYGITNRYEDISEENVHEILEYSLLNNIHHFDTSLLYGNSLERIEKYLSQNSKQSVHIINKFSIHTNLDETYSKLYSFLEKSKLSSYEALLIHDPDAKIDDAKKLESFLEKLINNKLTKKIGCSIYSPSEFKKMNQIFPMKVVQCPINPFNVKFLTEQFGKNVEIHGRSLFLQGILLADQLPTRLSKLQPHILKFKEILKASNMNPLEGLFRWANQQKNVSKWVIGVTDKDELHQIIKTCDSVDSSSKTIDFGLLSKHGDDPLLNPQNWN